MRKIPVILLAAGHSSRMGGADKLMQSVGGVPLLRLTASKALAVGPVIVALPPEPHPRHEALEGLDVVRVGIPDASEGMNASLRGAVGHIPQEAPRVMVLLADLPDLTQGDLIGVATSAETHSDHLIWRGTSEDGKPGHPVVFDRFLFPDLLNLSGDTGAQEIVKRYPDKTHLHRLPGKNAVLDLDTPADW